jgi:hypothetical protein
MKTTLENDPKPAAGQPVFHNVAENLYRLESSGGYYALVKKGGQAISSLAQDEGPEAG